MVIKAFKKLDRDNSGVVEINDLKGVYNAKQHPDVKSGRKTEDEILAEFLDTFEIHYSILDKKLIFSDKFSSCKESKICWVSVSQEKSRGWLLMD